MDEEVMEAAQSHTHMISDLPELVVRVSEECASGSNWYVGK